MEMVRGITSLDLRRADAAVLLALPRGHWRIENELHYVCNVSPGEGACRVRSGNAPQVPVALRNAIAHFLAQVGAKSCPEEIELLQIHPDQAKAFIGIPH